MRFGLLMHTGMNGKKSKMEAIHIAEKLGETPIPMGTIVHMNNGAYFHFTEKIKYLGLWATTDLKDTLDSNRSRWNGIQYSHINPKCMEY
jgi:hypothetical protein